MKSVLTLFAISVLFGGHALAAESRPNVLFIALDDLNDWIGCLGGHPQTKTPNLDRLAASGVLFRNAYTAAASCNPSRTAIFSGRPPHRSGLYHNLQKMREVMPEAELLPRYFSKQGYWSAGSGKMLHYIIDPPSWDDYFPAKAKDNPFPHTFYPEKRPVNLPRGGDWQYVETDWAALDVTDEQFGGDWAVTKWIGEQLQRPHDKPFFLACGIYRPHEPWFMPKKYFEPFPLESIQLPPGYKADDVDDLPPAGQRLARNRYFAHIQKHEQWKKGIQAYLASIHFADAMLGRVLDALEKSPQRDNTIVLLWNDHGWHLGEKEHWQKFTGWRVCARVPLMIRVPKGAPGLLEGTTPGSVCDQPNCSMRRLQSGWRVRPSGRLLDCEGSFDSNSFAMCSLNTLEHLRAVLIHKVGNVGENKAHSIMGISDIDWRSDDLLRAPAFYRFSVTCDYKLVSLVNW